VTSPSTKRPKPQLFKKGSANPGSKARRAQTGSGRAKGTKNKFSRDVKESILNALEQLGGDQWFVKLGKSSKHKSSMAGLVKALIPIQVQGAGAGSPEEQAAKVRAKLAQMEGVTSGDGKDDKSGGAP
jgi:hypothetical protein